MTTIDPTAVTRRPDFDHATSPLLAGDPFAGWSALRDAGRAFSSGIGGDYDLWYLLQYEDVRTAFQDYERFSSKSVQYVGHSPQSMIPEELDPPQHAKYRRLLNTPLTPAAVRAMEADVRAHCVALIEGFVEAGRCEFLADFAQRFPTEIFMRVMGLPIDRTAEFIGRAHVLLHTSAADDPDFRLRRAAAGAIIGDIATAIAEHRAQHSAGTAPADMITHLLESRIDDRPVTDDELAQIGFLLYTAGLDTVANVLTFAFHHLAGDPALRARLRAEPELVPTAVEEFLRHYSIVTVARVVTTDTEFAGCPMKAGDRVVLPTPAAARDGAQFPDPERFDPARTPNRHLAFGAGPHRCAGSHLARLELQVALEEWHRRIPDYGADPETAIESYSGIVAGLSALPLTWAAD